MMAEEASVWEAGGRTARQAAVLFRGGPVPEKGFSRRGLHLDNSSATLGIHVRIISCNSIACPLFTACSSLEGGILENKPHSFMCVQPLGKDRLEV